MQSTKEVASHIASAGDSAHYKARGGNLSMSSFSGLRKVTRARQSESPGAVCGVFLEAPLFWNPSCQQHMGRRTYGERGPGLWYSAEAAARAGGPGRARWRRRALPGFALPAAWPGLPAGATRAPKKVN